MVNRRHQSLQFPDAQAESSAVELNGALEGESASGEIAIGELSPQDARDAFERLFSDLRQRLTNREVLERAARRGEVKRHGS